MNRYVIVQEPFYDWAVFDTSVDIPAIVDGQVAIGLSLSEAIFLAAKANEGDRKSSVATHASAARGGSQPERS